MPSMGELHIHFSFLARSTQIRLQDVLESFPVVLDQVAQTKKLLLAKRDGPRLSRTKCLPQVSMNLRSDGMGRIR